jgi:hypothetical protein
MNPESTAANVAPAIDVTNISSITSEPMFAGRKRGVARTRTRGLIVVVLIASAIAVDAPRRASLRWVRDTGLIASRFRRSIPRLKLVVSSVRFRVSPSGRGAPKISRPERSHRPDRQDHAPSLVLRRVRVRAARTALG